MSLFGRFLQVFRLESSLATGQQNKKGISNMNAENSTELTRSGRISRMPGQKKLLRSLEVMESAKRLVATAAINKLFETNYFDICTLNSVMELIDARRGGDSYKMLHALHCIHYSKMDPDLVELIPDLVNDCLRQQSNVQFSSIRALDGVDL